MIELETQWNVLLGALGVPPALSRPVWANVRRRYQAPGRHYHTLDHIAALLELVEQHRAQLADAAAVQLAVWFHDAVYSPLRPDNEERSAALARRALQSMGLKLFSPKVEQYIIGTKGHQAAPHDSDLQYFLDCDLAILAAPPAQYQAYTQQIRQEYSIFPDAVYKPGRRRVLEHFLARPRIYGQMDEWERPARQNLAHELAQLT